MNTSTQRPRSLLGNLALFIGAPLAMNGLIFALGWQGAATRNPMLPPGWVIGVIWTLLFAGMGVAHWLVLRSKSPHAARWIQALALLCLVYPLYTAGLSSELIGLIGALATTVVAAIAAFRLSRVSRPATAFTVAVLAWLLYAETALARDLRR